MHARTVSSQASPGQVRIGCSGWKYRHWRGLFYPEGLRQARWFAFYAEHFDTVEINSSFHHLPRASTFETWRAQAPPGFCYAIKANRFLTQAKKLIGCEEPMERMMSATRLGKSPDLKHNRAMPQAEPLPYYDPPTMPFAKQRSEVRAAAGALVGGKLDSTAGVWRLSSRPDRPVQLYFKDNFLNADECRLMCERIDAGCYPSPLYQKEKYEGVRTSQSCNLNIRDRFVADVEARIAALLGIQRSWGEPLQGQKYAVGERFKEHADFFFVDQPYWAEYEPHGGQRTWTAMVYLNEPGAGGATGFRHLGLEVEPKLGRILIWNNMAADGSPNPWTMHEGRPVEDGVKYIVTKWYRERPFV